MKKNNEKKAHSVASLVLGLLSMTLFYLVGISTILGFVAIGLGKSGSRKAPGDKKNLAGMIMGAIGVVLSVATIAFGFLYGGAVIKYLTPVIDKTPAKATEEIEEVQELTEEVRSGKITYDNFNKVTIGMNGAQVAEILGEGVLTYEKKSGEHSYASYEWNYTDKFSNIYSIVVDFDNDSVEAKFQYGLSPVSHEVTKDMYDSVIPGMTYAEVEKILGGGDLSSMKKGEGDIIYSTYSWNNKQQLVLCSINFENDKVISKEATGLD